MSSNKPLPELIHIPRPQPSSRRRSKSRIKLKKLKTTTNTLIIRTPNIQNLSNADSGLIASEDDNQVHNPSFFANYDPNTDKKPEVLQTVLQHVLSETQQAPYAAYKSTLANLSKGLATMDEGEYLGWDGNDDSRSPLVAYTMMDNRRKSDNPQKYQQQPQNVNNTSYSNNNAVVLPMMRSQGQTPILKSSKSEKELPVVRTTNSREYRSKNSEHYRSGSNQIGDANNPILHSEPSAKNDIRWKEYNTLGEDLEFLKTEESLEALKPNINQRVITEMDPILVPLIPSEPKMKNKRSASVKNRRTLMQEFVEWKKALEDNRKALEKRLVNRSEKFQTPESRKEDFVLPKLNIGDEANKGFDKGYREWEVVRRQKSVEGVSIKPQSKNKGPKLSKRINSGLPGIKLEHSREEVTYEKSFIPIEGGEFRDELLNPMENNKSMKEMRSLSNARMRPRDGVIIWDELFMDGMPRSGEEGYLMQGDYVKALQEHWKTQGLVPKMAIKRDILVKKPLGNMGGKDSVKEDSRELSRENLKESKADIMKGIKLSKEASEKSKNKLAQLKNQNAALTEMLIAQTILNQRLRMLQDYGSKGREDKNEIIRTQEKIRLSILRKGSDSSLGMGKPGGAKEEKNNKKMGGDMKSGAMIRWEELHFNKRVW